MKIIVDSNIAFSALVNTNSVIADIIIGFQKKHKLYTCEYLLMELSNHHDKLKKASKMSDEQIEVAKYRLFKYIDCLSLEIIPMKCWVKAEEFVRDIDPDDIAFVALSLYLNAYLWTGDKVLYNGLKEKGFTKVFNTQEIKNLMMEE